jgi:hypothetical protein
MKLNSVQEILRSEWISKCYKHSFGIILPSGWLGRPFDNRHILSKLEISNNTIKITFDDIRSLTIYNPSDCEIVIDRTNSSLKFPKFTKIELEWIPYGDEETAKPIIKSYNYDELSSLELVGYFI